MLTLIIHLVVVHMKHVCNFISDAPNKVNVYLLSLLVHSEALGEGNSWGEVKQLARNRIRWRRFVDALCP
jgi:hypothetical protein